MLPLQTTVWLAVCMACRAAAVGSIMAPHLGHAQQGSRALLDISYRQSDAIQQTKPLAFSGGHHSVALCAIVRNQAFDLHEWLQYHQYIGVDKVYLYDNNSTEPLKRRIGGFLKSGFVAYKFFPGQGSHLHSTGPHPFSATPQYQAYNDCIHRFKHVHRWLGFIDVDEFIVLHPQHSAPQSTLPSNDIEAAIKQLQQHPPNIHTLLEEYEGFGGVALNWMIFGSSGHKQRPKGGVLLNYRQCLPPMHNENTHVKVIANTAHLISMGSNPHHVVYADAAYTVNELKQRVDGAFSSPPSHTKASLYHYVTKSKREYMQKMRRGAADGTHKQKAFFIAINAEATEQCVAAWPLGMACCPSNTRKLGQAGVARIEVEYASLARAAVDGTPD